MFENIKIDDISQVLPITLKRKKKLEEIQKEIVVLNKDDRST